MKQLAIVQEEIRELHGKECLQLRKLWETVFYEDSKEFTDYYFLQKAEHNIALTIPSGNEYAAMLYLSPCLMQMGNGRSWIEKAAVYLVGVATLEQYRHRKCMDRLLRRSFTNMHRDKLPFAFLMPADPKIYEPYQFTYIYNKEEYKLTGRLMKELAAAQHTAEIYTYSILKETELSDLSCFAEKVLAEQYRVFVKRDEKYYRGLARELQAQNGNIYLIREKNQLHDTIAGYFFCTEENGRTEIQEVLFAGIKEKEEICGSRGFLQTVSGKKPRIMARIMHVQTMLTMLRTKEHNISLIIQIEDPIVEENSGNWECYFEKGSADVKKKEAEGCEECVISIDQLTAWIFGCRRAEECFSFPENTEYKNVLNKLNELLLFFDVFINDIV